MNCNCFLFSVETDFLAIVLLLFLDLFCGVLLLIIYFCYNCCDFPRFTINGLLKITTLFWYIIMRNWPIFEIVQRFSEISISFIKVFICLVIFSCLWFKFLNKFVYYIHIHLYIYFKNFKISYSLSLYCLIEYIII
jgi:hypothetical protein